MSNKTVEEKIQEKKDEIRQGQVEVEKLDQHIQEIRDLKSQQKK
jgi:hypothetical protein